MSLDPAVIVLVPTGTADYNQTFLTDQWDAEATFYLSLTPGISEDPLDSTLTNEPQGGLWLKAHLDQLAKLPDVTDIERLTHRTMPGVSLVMTTPALVQGRPMTPKYWDQSDSSADLRTDPGHLDALDDPDPVWNSSTSSWTYSPPDGGVGDARWTTRALPFPDDDGYPLGARTSIDGSIKQSANTGRWFADSSTPTAPAWNSTWPFKPNVVTYTHHNQDGSTFEIQRAIQFNLHYAHHMWLDWGSQPAVMPFTWIMVGIVLDAKTGPYKHHLLDSGKSPFTYIKSPNEDTASKDINLPGTDEGLTYRSLITVDNSKMRLASATGKTLDVRVPLAPKPRMFYGIWNGANSYVGNYSHKNRLETKGKVATHNNSHRYLVMGRRNGFLGVRNASSMLIFEVRYWTRALTKTEINAQYAQLAASWKFSLYK